MRLDIIGKYLEDKGIATMGDDLFRNEMSSDVNEGVLLKTPLTGVPIDHYLPGFYRGRLQVIVRARTNEVGQGWADEILAALTIKQDTEFNDPDTGDKVMLVHHILPETLPIRYPRSDSNHIEWSLNFLTCFVIY